MSSHLEVAEFDGDPQQWNQFVSQHPSGSTFHAWEWRAVYRNAYQHETPFLGAYRNGALEGVLPLVRVRSAVFGHYLVSNPYVSYGGPLGTPDAERALAEEAVRRAKGAKLLELRSRAPISTSLTVSHRKLTVVMDIKPGDYEGTFKAFDSKLRSQVRRAEKAGMQVRFGTDQLAAFQLVLDEHMRDLGSPVHGPRFFGELAKALGERIWIGVGYIDDVPVAAGLAIENGTEVEISWASSLRRFSKVSPNMNLYGEFIRRACNKNFARFNFGRCSPDSGTHRFKRQWGGVDESLAWYQHSASGLVAPPTPDAGIYRVAARVWRELPLSLARQIGKRLIRGIP